eukprot:c19164_g1_i1.p1 GENE.c19164_g1_i1~~c19164_g1_i1.p1  ORF type:complete len:268 (+),score=56.94 c19164_g1_i1:264-1067(+)
MCLDDLVVPATTLLPPDPDAFDKDFHENKSQGQHSDCNSHLGCHNDGNPQAHNNPDELTWQFSSPQGSDFNPLEFSSAIINNSPLESTSAITVTEQPIVALPVVDPVAPQSPENLEKKKKVRVRKQYAFRQNLPTPRRKKRTISEIDPRPEVELLPEPQCSAYLATLNNRCTNPVYMSFACIDRLDGCSEAHCCAQHIELDLNCGYDLCRWTKGNKSFCRAVKHKSMPACANHLHDAIQLKVMSTEGASPIWLQGKKHFAERVGEWY